MSYLQLPTFRAAMDATVSMDAIVQRFSCFHWRALGEWWRQDSHGALGRVADAPAGRGAGGRSRPLAKAEAMKRRAR